MQGPGRSSCYRPVSLHLPIPHPTQVCPTLTPTPACSPPYPGVSAAFDAPVAGAFFAVEFVLKSNLLGLDRLSTATVFVSTSVAAGKCPCMHHYHHH